MANRRKGGKYRVEIITDSKELMGNFLDLIADEYEDREDLEVDLNYDGSTISKTIKINKK